MTCFVERLKTCRKERHLTQKQIAEAIGTSEQNYQRYERGSQQPTLSVLTALANCLHVPLDYLTGRGIFADWDMILAHWDIIQRELSAAPEPLGGFFQALFEKSDDKIQIVQTLNALIDQIEFQETDGQTTINFHWKI